MNNATKPQLSKIHVLLNQLNIMDMKATLVSEISNGRVSSSKDLTVNEAAELLRYLSQYDPCDRMRKKCFALAYNAGIIYGETPDDKKMNTAKLNMFLKDRGAVKKELHSMTYPELVKVVTQFEMIVKHSGETGANKATKSLLDELGIPVIKTQRSATKTLPQNKNIPHHD